MALQHEDVAGRATTASLGSWNSRRCPNGCHSPVWPFTPSTISKRPDWIELVDQVRGNIGRPDVVLRVDPQAVRAFEHPLAEAADEVAVGIEFRQRQQPAVDDEDIAFGIEGDAGRAAKIHARRQLEGFGDRDVGKWWKFHLHNPLLTSGTSKVPSFAGSGQGARPFASQPCKNSFTHLRTRAFSCAREGSGTPP